MYSDEECRLIVNRLQQCLNGVGSGEWIARVLGLPENDMPDGPVIVVVAPDVWPAIAATISELTGSQRLYFTNEQIVEELRLFNPDEM